jgi:major vault protein
VLLGPEPMTIIPPRNYCIITNPVVRDAEGAPVKNEHGNYKLRHGDEEIRYHTADPFPLFPGETLYGKVTPLQVVSMDSALRLRCLRDFKADDDKEYVAGDEWLFVGPGTYYPKVEVSVVETISAIVLTPDQGLKLRARRECNDASGIKRRAGEEWVFRGNGTYLQGVDEEVIEILKAYTLTERQALHLRATRTYTDQLGKVRKAGEEWLVTNKDAVTYVPDVYEEVVGTVGITVLNNRQYCVVCDPLDGAGKPQLGKKVLIKGEDFFFLQPGERLEKGIQNVYVLGDNEALLLRARETYTGSDNKEHAPGDRWMIYGPVDYIPPVEVEIIEKRRAIPLSDNEGVYVRDITSGKVRSCIGKSYMLEPNEELWSKSLPEAVEELLLKETGVTRDPTRVVSLRVPRNSAVQIYDYINKKSRTIFGPELVMLHPDEHFTILSLSGSKPKRPHVIKALCLQLGPEFMTDVVIVETSDHARLQLQLSYNWYFKTSKGSSDKLFQVPDFVGDACKAMASNIRGAVASVAFDEFHKFSARLIRKAVFGTDENGKINKEFQFGANDLCITNIDIQSVEPVDQRTRDSLQKSVQLAIEITTKSQEAAARHEAERVEQEARGRLERQKIQDEAEAEKARKDLLQLQAASAAVESTGQATAEAKARSEAAQIEGQSAVTLASLKAESSKILNENDLDAETARQQAEIEYRTRMDLLEIERAAGFAKIESEKFKKTISAIGRDTIAAIAQAGPEMQAKLLEGLGIKSLLITDGNSPINLFNTANGLITNPQ